jgi:hypothetical protein
MDMSEQRFYFARRGFELQTPENKTVRFTRTAISEESAMLSAD